MHGEHYLCQAGPFPGQVFPYIFITMTPILFFCHSWIFYGISWFLSSSTPSMLALRFLPLLGFLLKLSALLLCWRFRRWRPPCCCWSCWHSLCYCLVVYVAALVALFRAMLSLSFMVCRAPWQPPSLLTQCSWVPGPSLFNTDWRCSQPLQYLSCTSSRTICNRENVNSCQGCNSVKTQEERFLNKFRMGSPPPPPNDFFTLAYLLLKTNLQTKTASQNHLKRKAKSC